MASYYTAALQCEEPSCRDTSRSLSTHVSRDDAGRFDEWLFDLSRDPGEASSLIESRPNETARLKRMLATWEQEVQPARKRPGT